MNKGAVEKILNKGTPKQRLILLSNHLVDQRAKGKGWLTDAEFSSLVDSFKSSQEINLYNHFRRLHITVANAVAELSVVRLVHEIEASLLLRRINLRQSNANTEELVNTLLDLFPDKKTRANAIQVVKRFSNPAIFRIFKEDGSGYVNLGHGTLVGDYLEREIEKRRVIVRKSQGEVKTRIAVIRDYMEETGFNIKAFKDVLNEVEAWAKSEKDAISMMTPKELRKSFNPRHASFLEQNFVEADYDEVQIDAEKYNTLLAEMREGKD